jgi:hypothetical protein
MPVASSLTSGSTSDLGSHDCLLIHARYLRFYSTLFYYIYTFNTLIHTHGLIPFFTLLMTYDFIMSFRSIIAEYCSLELVNSIKRLISFSIARKTIEGLSRL